MLNEKESLFKYVGHRIREREFLIVALPYLAFCLFSTVWWSVNFVLGHFILSASFVLFIPAILLVEYIFSMRFGTVFTVSALLIAVGAVLGSPFGFYSIFPSFDAILHTISGFVFASLGFALAAYFFGSPASRRAYVGCIVFGLSFSLGIAVLWELWEFGGTLLLGMETADDTVVDSFKTFALTGRSEAVVVEGILKTVIYYGDGETLVIDGYLDIGYFDTLGDMIVCTVGALIFALVSALSRAFAPGLESALVPRVFEKKNADASADLIEAESPLECELFDGDSACKCDFSDAQCED